MMRASFGLTVENGVRLMKHILIGVLALAAAASASAENYIGAALGPSHIDIDCRGYWSCDSGDTGFKLYGGLDVSRHTSVQGLALEAGYIDFGSAKATTGPISKTVDVSAATFDAALRVHFSPAFSGVGRLGLAYVEGKASDPFGSNSSSNLKLHGGLGLEYAINRQFKIVGAADFTSYDTGGETGSASLLSVGVQYGF
jgi:hypothetical protein